MPSSERCHGKQLDVSEILHSFPYFSEESHNETHNHVGNSKRRHIDQFSKPLAESHNGRDPCIMVDQNRSTIR